MMSPLPDLLHLSLRIDYMHGDDPSRVYQYLFSCNEHYPSLYAQSFLGVDLRVTILSRRLHAATLHDVPLRVSAPSDASCPRPLAD
jgi:hypothetical protein